MKEHPVSQSIAPPSGVTVTYDPSATALMTDWLADRVRRAIEISVDTAQHDNVRLKKISIEGWESYEESTRELVVIPEIISTDDSAFSYWDALAEAIHHLNESPPKGSKHQDVTIQVSVRW